MMSVVLLIPIFCVNLGHALTVTSIGDPLVIENTSDGTETIPATQDAVNAASNYCLDEHNRVRSQNNLTNFTSDSRLEAAAAGHNDVMVSQNCFKHQCSDEASLGDRITNQGYQWSSAAENIAMGFSDCQAAVDAWMKSDGHRANILGKYRDIGCAERDKYYTCDFANPS